MSFELSKETIFADKFVEAQKKLGKVTGILTDETVKSFGAPGLNTNVAAVVCTMLVHNKIKNRSPNISDISEYDVTTLGKKDWRRYRVYIEYLIGPEKIKPIKSVPIKSTKKKAVTKIDAKTTVRKNAVVKSTATAAKSQAIANKRTEQYAMHIAMFNRYLLIMKMHNIRLEAKHRT